MNSDDQSSIDDERSVLFTVLTDKTRDKSKYNFVELELPVRAESCLTYIVCMRSLVSARRTRGRDPWLEDFLAGWTSSVFLQPNIMAVREEKQDYVSFGLFNSADEEMKVRVSEKLCEPLWTAMIGYERSKSDIRTSRHAILKWRHRKVKQEFNEARLARKRQRIQMRRMKKREARARKRQPITQPDNGEERIDACKVCLTEKKTHSMIPCGHYAYCSSCSKRLTSCAICRAEKTGCMEIFE